MSYSMQVIQAIQSEQLESVDSLIDKAFQEDTNDDLYLLADSLYQLGFLDETKRILNHLLTLNSGDDELRINLAEIAIEEGEDLDAIAYLDAVDKTSPAYVQSLLVAADYYQTQDLPEVSEAKLVEAKNLMPDEPIILFGLAELHYSMGQYNQAIRYYNDCLQLGVSEVATIQLKARIGTAYSAIGDFEQAIAYLSQAAEDKEDIDTLFNLAITYYQIEEYSRAIEYFKHVESLDHTYTSIYPYLADALDHEMRQDEAAQVVKDGVRLDNTNVALYLMGAKIAIKQHDLDLAQDYYQKAYDLNPTSETTLIEYANFLIYTEDYQQAIDLVSYAMDQESIDPQFYWVLANAHNYQENYQEAGQYYEKAYEHFSDNRYFLQDYTLYLQEEGRNDQLKSVVKDYLLIDPSDTEFKDLLVQLENDY